MPRIRFAPSTTATSSAFDLSIDLYPTRVSPVAEAYLTVSTTCSVAVEILEIGDVWRSYPELTFVGPTAQYMLLKRTSFRLVVHTSAQTNVEIQW